MTISWHCLGCNLKGEAFVNSVELVKANNKLPKEQQANDLISMLVYHVSENIHPNCSDKIGVKAI